MAPTFVLIRLPFRKPSQSDVGALTSPSQHVQATHPTPVPKLDFDRQQQSPNPMQWSVIINAGIQQHFQNKTAAEVNTSAASRERAPRRFQSVPNDVGQMERDRSTKAFRGHVKRSDSAGYNDDNPASRGNFYNEVYNMADPFYQTEDGTFHRMLEPSAPPMEG